MFLRGSKSPRHSVQRWRWYLFEPQNLQLHPHYRHVPFAHELGLAGQRCGDLYLALWAGEVSFQANGTITLSLKELTTGLSAQMEELARLLAKHFEN